MHHLTNKHYILSLHFSQTLNSQSIRGLIKEGQGAGFNMGEELEQKQVSVEAIAPTEAGHEEEKTAIVEEPHSKPITTPPLQKNIIVSGEEQTTQGSLGRDAELARVATEKRQSLIKAWEESEKSKADNKAHKKLSEISGWENTKKATIEADLRKNEEELEKKRAEKLEKMKNRIAMIHKEAEEKRAVIEAKRAESFLKAEELAAKYRATGGPPNKFLPCFP